MRIFIQRPYLAIHSNYDSVHVMRAYPSGKEITIEIWAGDMPEQGIRYMDNGVMADLTMDQAIQLRDLIDKAIQEMTKNAPGGKR